jgi:hypothetical protein
VPQADFHDGTASTRQRENQTDSQVP